ncbi:hypothetical protein C0J52_19271 [Blattella germanica]|nr:hypothetical protein C0J52_19271 [Blattella germanica]
MIILTHLRECGSAADKKRTGRQAILTAAILVEVRNVMECSPPKSLRGIIAVGFCYEFNSDTTVLLTKKAQIKSSQ